jgi:hypothetical protein
MIRKIIEIVFGLVIAFSLIAKYSNGEHESKLLIWYVLTPGVLKVIVWVVLFFIAGRLLYGRYNDYSRGTYKFLTKLFGDPTSSKGTI